VIFKLGAFTTQDRGLKRLGKNTLDNIDLSTDQVQKINMISYDTNKTKRKNEESIRRMSRLIAG
jgi:Spy/CpxP family protein refolding chaperone